MRNPAMTWRVRRIGRALWSIRTHATSWIAIEPTRRAPLANEPSKHRDQPSRSVALDEPFVTSDSGHWLAALRLDRAACAVREPD
jgi:hypothetical protein